MAKVITSLGARGPRATAKPAAKPAAKSTKKSTASKTAAKKSAAKPSGKKVAAKPAAKKSAAKKAATKPAAKKSASKQAPVKKVAAKKVAVKQAAVKQVPAKPAAKTAAAKPTKVTAPVEEKPKGRRRAPLSAEEMEKLPVPLAHQGTIDVPKAFKQPDSIPKDKQRISDDESLWSAAELKAMRKRLETDLAEREIALTSARELLDELISFTDDGAGGETADTGNTILEREEQISRVTDAEAKYEQSKAAIERIDAKRFGFCEECGKPIGKLRLQEGNPYATLCIKCKELADRAY